MLEKMDEFFAARVAGYDEHMLSEIEGSKEFYPYCLDMRVPECWILAAEPGLN